MLAIHYGTAGVTGGNLIIQATASGKHNRYRLKNQNQDEIYGEQLFYHSAFEDNGTH